MLSDGDLPDGVVEYFQRLDEEGKRALGKESFWVDRAKGGWVDSKLLHRYTTPVHYVVGRLSPFYTGICRSKDRQRAMMGVWFGPYTSNGGGTGQGGAQGAIFDFLCAFCVANAQPYTAPTGTLTTRMTAPLLPIPGVIRAEAWIERTEGRKIFVKGEITDPQGKTVFATAHAIHIVIDKPKQSKL